MDFTKYLVRTKFTIGTQVYLTKFLSLTYLQNTGVSFGMLKGFNWIFIIVSFIALFFVYKLCMDKSEKKNKLQYYIIIAGIIGNLIDRIFLGYVVDFISVEYFSVFNIADSCISIGVFWLIIKHINKKT